MKTAINNRINPSIAPLEYFEINLPTYLQLSLDQWKYDERDSLKDCFYDDLYSSINIAETEDAITVNHATYLRERFLGL